MRRASLVVALALLAAASACRKPQPQAKNISEANNVAMRPVRLYFEDGNSLLTAELHNLPLPENPAAAIPLVVREMMKGPGNASLARLFPPDTIVRGAYLLPDGTAFVDLGGATLQQGWGTGTHEELMAVFSLVQTVTTNFAEVKKVRLLVNGEPAETLAGHVWLGRSLRPMASLVEPASR